MICAEILHNLTYELSSSVNVQVNELYFSFFLNQLQSFLESLKVLILALQKHDLRLLSEIIH